LDQTRVKSGPENREISNQARKVLNQSRKIPNQGWEMSNQARKLLNQARKIPNQGRKLSNQGPGNQKWIAGSSLNRNWKDCGNRPLIRMINFDWESGNRLNFD